MQAAHLIDGMYNSNYSYTYYCEVNAIVAIGFNGVDCDIRIVTIVLDITHLTKSDFNDIIYYTL